jgi:DNA-binding NtrC family response regulator
MGYGPNRAGGAGREGAGGAGKAAELRTVVLASGDAHCRARLRQQLTAMRWQVREAGGGAEAMAQLESQAAEAMVLDSPLPDLEVGEFARQMRSRHPVMDLLRVDEGVGESGARSPRRNELLHALRRAQEEARGAGAAEMPAWATAPVTPPRASGAERLAPGGERAAAAMEVEEALRARGAVAEAWGPFGGSEEQGAAGEGGVGLMERGAEGAEAGEIADGLPGERVIGERRVAAGMAPARVGTLLLPEIMGQSAGMVEMARMVRLVAPRSTAVLIEGETGTGKELVAKAVHRLSARASKPFVVLNCAAIPESLLEAELFGHTRGAFTGAVQSRMGRIEAAHGGTLFLDEIGEMPLGLQPKMLRFLEAGELQRVGDNETMRVDVRVIAATHQHLRERAAERTFRLDLYHRLAVFPVFLPALKDRMEDVPLLAAYLLEKMGEEMPVKRLSAGAAARLMEYDWPGNVRELAHVLERGAIFAEDRREIGREEIRF